MSKLILFEPLLKKAKGHHLDVMIESTLFFGRYKKILWIINKEFDQSSYYLPKETEILKIIDTEISEISKKFSFFKNINLLLKYFY